MRRYVCPLYQHVMHAKYDSLLAFQKVVAGVVYREYASEAKGGMNDLLFKWEGMSEDAPCGIEEKIRY